MRACVAGLGWIGPWGAGRGGDPVGFAAPDGSVGTFSLKEILPQAHARLGRMDYFTKLGLAGASLAIGDSGIEPSETKRRYGVVGSTWYGCLQTDIDYYETALEEGGKLASPNLFAYTLPNCFIGEVAIGYGFTGPTMAVSEPDNSGLEALKLAVESICWGEADGMVVGVVDPVRPTELDPAPRESSGAMFAVLNDREDSSYGYLELRAGKTFFEGARIDGFTEFMISALAGGRAGRTGENAR